MTIISLLWLGVWGGMFTDITRLNSSGLYSNFLSFFQGARALFPLLSLLICVMWILAVRTPFNTKQSAIGFLILYSLVGLLSSFFVSPQRSISLYWGAIFLSPLLVIWISQQIEEPLSYLNRIIMLNYIVSTIIFLFLLPETIKIARGSAPMLQIYQLPFQLGNIKVNGVGRFALIVIIFSFVRLSFSHNRLRFLWILLLAPALITLAYTRSRTALLGLAVASLIFVYLKGINWRFFFAGPVAAYVLYISGYKWRAQQQMENLIGLTGRDYTWARGIAQVKQSPLFGWGFHADRLMLDSEHMHNSYVHSMIQAGILGGVFFIAAMVSIWLLIRKNKLFKRIRELRSTEQILLIECFMLIGFFTSRSFFESTAAFYGVDLLVFAPAVCYIFLWVEKNKEFLK